jgi:hypothetical protein
VHNGRSSHHHHHAQERSMLCVQVSLRLIGFSCKMMGGVLVAPDLSHYQSLID